jgi:UDP-N-acetyl-L-fucosamine synthase
MLKTLIICGTRPEIVRLSVIIQEMDKYFDNKIVFTNQSFSYEMGQIFFDELKIRKPDYTLDVKSDTVGEQIGKIITQTEQVMLKEKPDAILILGDTNSALSCIVAKRLKIIIFHMEAGNRSFDQRVPEEINRRIVDHAADINLAYTEHARRNLLTEGLPTQNIFVTGSPLVEVYDHYKEQVNNSKILEKLKLKKGGYIIASIHRDENISNKDTLEQIMESMRLVADTYNKTIIFSTHPRTRKIIYPVLNSNIKLHKPFGLFDYLKLQQNAFITLSDSGSLHEDCAILGFPALNIREANERPEAYDAGNLIMTGLKPENILNSVAIVRKQYENGINIDNPYGDGFCSHKVIRLIQGLTDIMHKRLYYV